MNVVLQRHCAKYIYAVPDGLRELMTDISREVLRTQPENLYTFIADYLDALMITRENARVAARLVEHITEISITIVELLLRTGMTREQADEVARVIQMAFRRFIRRKERKKMTDIYGTQTFNVGEDENVEGEEEHEYEGEEEQFVGEILEELALEKERQSSAAKIIQAAFRKFKERQQYEQDLLYGMVDWRIAARHTISLYRHAGVSEAEANRAATLIKSAYKGYYTRRVMKKLLEKGLKEEEEDEESESSNEEISERRGGSIQSAEELDDDEDQKKSVRINFDTVKPHVDYDYEPTVIGGGGKKEEGSLGSKEGRGSKDVSGVSVSGVSGGRVSTGRVPSGSAQSGSTGRVQVGSVKSGSAQGTDVQKESTQDESTLAESIQAERVQTESVQAEGENIPTGVPLTTSEGAIISTPSEEMISAVEAQSKGDQGEEIIQREDVGQGENPTVDDKPPEIEGEFPIEEPPSEAVPPSEEVPVSEEVPPNEVLVANEAVLVNEPEVPIEQVPIVEEVPIVQEVPIGEELPIVQEVPNQPPQEINEVPLETGEAESQLPTETGDTTDRTDFTTTETTTGEDTTDYTTDDTGEATEG